MTALLLPGCEEEVAKVDPVRPVRAVLVGGEVALRGTSWKTWKPLTNETGEVGGTVGSARALIDQTSSPQIIV
jgi:hypothetical protein